jgi:hypothetical protein
MQLTTITVVLFTALLASCSEKERTIYPPLTEKEMYDVLNEGYTAYADSVRHEYFLLRYFTRPLDPEFAQSIVLFLETFHPNYHPDLPKESLIMISYQERSTTDQDSLRKVLFNGRADINSALLNETTLVNYLQADSLNTILNNLDTVHKYIPVYAITRPHRFSFSDYVILEERPFTLFKYCSWGALNSLVFKKINNRWKVVRVFE